jgi:hypothetical protein
MTCFLKNNILLSDDAKCYFGTVFAPKDGLFNTERQENLWKRPFRAAADEDGGELLLRKNSIEEKFPSFKGKISFIRTQVEGVWYPAYFLQLRKWSGNVDKFNFKFGAKFGPFDALYRPIGHYEKKYLRDENKLDPELLALSIANYLDPLI